MARDLGEEELKGMLNYLIQNKVSDQLINYGGPPEAGYGNTPKKVKSVRPKKVKSVKPKRKRRRRPKKPKYTLRPPDEDPGFIGEDLGYDDSLVEGLKASAIGQLLGFEPMTPTEDASFAKSLAFKAGALGGDIPTMSAGGALGGALAGLLGGGPLGAAIGAGAGAFGMPEFIKQIVSYAKSPSDKKKSMVEKIGAVGDIFLQAGKQALVGGATGGAGRLFPLIKMVPGMNKMLGTKAGREVIKAGAELAAMTGASSAIEGEVPSLKEVAENALLLGGMKGAGAIVGGAKKALGKKALPKATRKTAKAEVAQLKKKALELAPKKVSVVLEKFKKQQPAFDLLREHIGKRNERVVGSQFKWKKIAEKAQAKGEFTPKQLEEAINYRQKTGNPEVKGDTFEKLKERIPESLRKVVDTDIDSHFRKSMAEINKKPYLKKIKPREGLAETYVTGFYENPEKFQSIQNKLPKEVQLRNPFANMKSFLDYNEALTKAGMKPRYKNIFDLMQAYDKTTSKMIAGSDLLTEISKVEKSTGDRIIVNPNEFEAYQEAKQQGYVPFYDPIVKEFGRADGKKWRPSDKPALVAPEFADAFQGIFSKQAYSPESPFWKTYDNVADLVRFGRVKLSFFHYVPLTESAAGALGPKRAFKFKSIAEQGSALRSNEAFMKDAARHGLVIHKPVERYERAKKTGGKLVDTAMKYLPEKVVTKASESLVGKGLKKLAKSQEYLFEQYHPNLKAVTWQDFVGKAIEKSINEGKPPSAKQRIQIKTQMADLVNSMYGGQNWDVQRVFNNPQYRKWLRRAIGYPDWTTSAIRQAAGAFSGGLKGEHSRRYWMKFGVNSLLAHGALQYIFGGMKQTDKDKSVSGIRWDPVKAAKTVFSPDPIEWYKFPLPDVPVKIAGKVFNPGREAATEWKKQGSKLYTHFGKQALEIKDWVKHPLRTLFSKSNPLISMIWKQVLDSTPSDRKSFTARGKWKKGARERMPWDATEPYTPARLVSRMTSVLEDVSPFAMRTLFDKGIAPYVATGLGSVPISKGTTPYKAAPALEKAFKKNDNKMVNRIRAALKDNGYSAKQIKRAVNSARKRAGK